MTLDDLKKIINANWDQNKRLSTIKEEDITKRYLYITGLTSLGVNEEGEAYDLDSIVAEHEDDETYIERLAWNIPGSSGLDLDEDENGDASEVTPEVKPEPEPEPEDDEEEEEKKL